MRLAIEAARAGIAKGNHPYGAAIVRGDQVICAVHNIVPGSVDATEGPAVDALNQSADAVEGSMTDIIPPELKDALTSWIDGARATAKAITGKAPAGEFNQTIGDLNDTRSNALSLCDATY